MQKHLSWQARSFLIEIKAKKNLASVYVDCPFESENKCSEDPAELLKVGNQSIAMIANWTEGKIIFCFKQMLIQLMTLQMYKDT